MVGEVDKVGYRLVDDRAGAVRDFDRAHCDCVELDLGRLNSENDAEDECLPERPGHSEIIIAWDRTTIDSWVQNLDQLLHRTSSLEL